ncbi:MAG: PLP-dependent aminotransferase family protein [Deltaproteobacteria bacterium]|nr:PLP-dependent aminotransferase family protein [Deltaproteobacteria bacterium]
MLNKNWSHRQGAVADRLAAELIDAIVSGRLLPGTLLPSQRSLAKSAGTSRTTVAAALDDLSRRRWIEPRRNARCVARLPDAGHQGLSPVHALSDSPRERARVAAPAAELSAAYTRAHRRLHQHLHGDGRVRGGLVELRKLVAERYSESGLATTAQQVTITNGAMGAWVATLDATKGTVLVEDPTYHGALEHLRRRRRRLVGWQRSSPWDLDALATLVKTHRPRLVYAVPDFHNPTGQLASDEERASLAAFGSRTMIVVDETLRDLQLDPNGTLPGHVARFHPNIVTIGGLSKTVWSGLRLGWLRRPDSPNDSLDAALDAHPVPIIEQLIAIELWPHLNRLIEARCQLLRRQRDVMIAALSGVGFHAEAPVGGLVCWVDLGHPIAESVAFRMNAEGHSIAPGQRFSPSGSYRTHVRLPFTTSVEEMGDMAEALRRQVLTEVE